MEQNFEWQSGMLLAYRGTFAVLSAVNGNKLELRLADGASRSVRPKDVEFLHEGPIVKVDFTPHFPEPDEALIAELLDEDIVSINELAELVYEKNIPETVMAAYRFAHGSILLEYRDRDHIGRASKDLVARRREIIENAEQKRRSFVEFAEQLRAGVVPESEFSRLAEIELVASGKSRKSKLLEELNISPTPVNALRLLSRISGYHSPANPGNLAMEDTTLPLPPIPQERRLDWTKFLLYAVDDPGCPDPDDAIGWDGERILVAVADVASSVDFGDEVDLEARKRGETLYFDEGNVNMLPPASLKQFALWPSEKIAALGIAFRIAADGHAELEEVAPVWGNISALTYRKLDSHLNDDLFQTMGNELKRFKLWRLKKRYPDGDEAFFAERAAMPLSASIFVENAMVACGVALAEWAAKNGLAMPYCEIRGIERYLRVTSPLRRYGDLLAHEQLRRWIRNQTLIPGEEMNAAMAVAAELAPEREAMMAACRADGNGWRPRRFWEVDELGKEEENKVWGESLSTFLDDLNFSQDEKIL